MILDDIIGAHTEQQFQLSAVTTTKRSVINPPPRQYRIIRSPLMDRYTWVAEKKSHYFLIINLGHIKSTGRTKIYISIDDSSVHSVDFSFSLSPAIGQVAVFTFVDLIQWHSCNLVCGSRSQKFSTPRNIMKTRRQSHCANRTKPQFY